MTGGTTKADFKAGNDMKVPRSWVVWTKGWL